ncbi:hypothetical protein ACP70R_034947 [Stipagrostis hirtigluma subsp. patula]
MAEKVRPLRPRRATRGRGRRRGRRHRAASSSSPRLCPPTPRRLPPPTPRRLPPQVLDLLPIRPHNVRAWQANYQHRLIHGESRV